MNLPIDPDNDIDFYQSIAATYRSDMPASLKGAIGVMWVMGLCGEAGEVAEKIKKLHRDSSWGTIDRGAFRELLKKELGDVAWYLSQLARDFDIKLSDVLSCNLVKLEDRRQRNVLSGSGDSR
jgi:NTP pyrophosphatase (non-canonical NTP hydrolase)